MNTATQRRAEYQDRGAGGLADHFTRNDLNKCDRFLLAESTVLGLRDRLAMNLSYSCLLRGHSVRNADLCDFHCIDLPGEGPMTCPALCMAIDIDKTNQEGTKFVMGAIRSRDYEECVLGSLAMYLFGICLENFFQNLTLTPHGMLCDRLLKFLFKIFFSLFFFRIIKFSFRLVSVKFFVQGFFFIFFLKYIRTRDFL